MEMMIRMARCRCWRVKEIIRSVNRFEPSVCDFPTSERYFSSLDSAKEHDNVNSNRRHTLCASSRMTALP